MLAERHIHTVLAVDDDDDNLTALLFFLEAAGCRVRGASTGHHALRLLEEGFRPCVALIDVIMPGMSGWDLVRHLRAGRDTATLPIVMFTGAVEDPARSRERGVQAVLVKGCEPDAIANAIATYCPDRDRCDRART